MHALGQKTNEKPFYISTINYAIDYITPYQTHRNEEFQQINKHLDAVPELPHGTVAGSALCAYRYPPPCLRAREWRVVFLLRVVLSERTTETPFFREVAEPLLRESQ